MNRYTVIWIPSAENELGQIWLAASDRENVALASHKIDVALRDDAEGMSVEIDEGLRGLEISPLRVLFEVLSGNVSSYACVALMAVHGRRFVGAGGTLLFAQRAYQTTNRSSSPLALSVASRQRWSDPQCGA